MLPLSFSQDQIVLINILLRIAVMAGIISLVLGLRSTIALLARVSAGRGAQLRLFIALSLFFAIGVAVRKLSNQAAMDLSLEGALVAGLLGGAWVGTGTGLVIGLTGYFFGEVMALPLYTLVGAVSGLLYSWLGKRGEIWSFSLNPFLIVYNFFERLFKGALDRNFIPFALCVGLALLRYYLVDRFYSRGWLYGYPSRDWFFIVLDLAVTVYTVGIALKMADNARMEEILRQEKNQLVHARLATLRSQINPHFLFNTLNSISALIRTDADKAREMTRKLSSIFRKSLEDEGEMHTLCEEVDFLEDYLSIEKVRFGEEKLRFERDIDAGSASCRMPTMLLQPLIENAVKHGISCTTGGGTIRIMSRRAGEGYTVTVTNDGPPGGPLDIAELAGRGVGLRNVMERLKIYTRGEGRLSIRSRDGGGAEVTLEIPRIV